MSQVYSIGKSILFAASALTILMAHSGQASSPENRFVCPLTVHGTTAAKAAEIKRLLPADNIVDSPSRLNESIDTLRRFGLSKAMIIDHLIAAYCPTVTGDTSLTDSEKTTRVRRFASRLTLAVYAEEEASQIILDIPLKPELVDQVNDRARKAGESAEKWIAGAIEAALTHP